MLLRNQMNIGPPKIDTDQPVEIELTGGRKLHLCGRIDRIDQISRVSPPAYVIWDYKTGSDWSYDQADAIGQGRKLQPLLYWRMLATRFEQLGRNPKAIAGFGYFFPSPRSEVDVSNGRPLSYLQGNRFSKPCWMCYPPALLSPPTTPTIAATAIIKRYVVIPSS